MLECERAEGRRGSERADEAHITFPNKKEPEGGRPRPGQLRRDDQRGVTCVVTSAVTVSCPGLPELDFEPVLGNG